MIRSLVAALSVLTLTCLARAQEPLEPPGIAEPAYWEIHDDEGYIGFDIAVEYGFYDPEMNADVYFLHVTGIVGGQPYYSLSYLWDDGSGGPLVVLNGDSGSVTEWHWDNDHYVKVGGTAHYREYHPVF